VTTGGPWFLSATSAGVDWRMAAESLVTAAGIRMAVLAFDTADQIDAATRLDVHDPGGLTLAEATTLVRALVATHERTLVTAAGQGALLPLGRDGWTLAELAAATGGTFLVVTGPGPDAVNHTTLTLGALAGQGVSASVVTIGEVDEEALPVTPAGRIPDPPEGDPADWFDPALRTAPPVPPPVLPPRTVTGKRVVLGLVAVFVIMVLAVCGLAMRDPGETRVELSPIVGTEQTASAGWVTGPPVPLPVPAQPRRLATDACPQNAGRVTVTRPDATTTARVNAAWQRIEKWLAAHAPATARELRPGAPAGQVDAVQRQMSVAFPPDLVTSLRRHNGVTDQGFTLPPFFAPSSLGAIRGDWEVTCGVLANQDTSWTDDEWWHKQFVPFASAGDGGSLVVDQRPGGHGRVGEFYPEDGTSFEKWPASVTELLEGTAQSLETGRAYARHYTPKVTDGRLYWDVK
jgi:cell wall assembly regulator SMI1